MENANISYENGQLSMESNNSRYFKALYVNTESFARVAQTRSGKMDNAGPPTVYVALLISFKW